MTSRFRLLALLLPCLLWVCACAGGAGSAPGAMRLGFVVKQPEEPWFQLEARSAEFAGKEPWREVAEVGANDLEGGRAAIDTLAARAMAGCVICTQDVRPGPAIAALDEFHEPLKAGVHGSWPPSVVERGRRTLPMLQACCKDGVEPPLDPCMSGALITRGSFEAVLLGRGITH